MQIGDETHMFRRLRSLDDGACPVFEHGDLEKSVRLRVEDISRDADRAAWLYCCCLFSKGQLPPHIAGALPSGFDAQHELVESIGAVQVPAAEVIGVSRVISTSVWRSLSPSDRSGVCHPSSRGCVCRRRRQCREVESRACEEARYQCFICASGA